MDELDIYDLKQEFGDIYSVVILENQYIFRLISRKEYAEISNEECEDEDKEDYIVNCCLLATDCTKERDDIYAGVFSVLSEYIMYQSGLLEQSAQEIGIMYYNEMQDPDNIIDAIIIEAFPAIRLEELETWTVNKTLKYFSRAEWILHNLRGINVGELLQPKEQKIDYIDPNDRSY